jgi:hypothetical protein
MIPITLKLLIIILILLVSKVLGRITNAVDYGRQLKKGQSVLFNMENSEKYSKVSRMVYGGLKIPLVMVVLNGRYSEKPRRG